MTTKKRTRRTPDQRIADLQAEIERLKQRAAEKKVKKDPSLRHIAAAVRSLDKATSETQDKVVKEALTEARASLAACLSMSGVPLGRGSKSGTARSPRVAPDAKQVLAYIREHPGSRSAGICNALGTDAASLRPVLHELRDEGKIRVDGKARATTYRAAK